MSLFSCIEKYIFIIISKFRLYFSICISSGLCIEMCLYRKGWLLVLFSSHILASLPHKRCFAHALVIPVFIPSSSHSTYHNFNRYPQVTPKAKRWTQLHYSTRRTTENCASLKSKFGSFRWESLGIQVPFMCFTRECIGSRCILPIRPIETQPCGLGMAGNDSSGALYIMQPRTQPLAQAQEWYHLEDPSNFRKYVS